MAEITDSIEVPEPGRSQDDNKPRRGGKRAKKGPLARLALFYRQIVAELRKVVWPTKKQLSTYTTVVIIFVLVIIGLVTVIDWGFTEVVKYVFG
ncbi:preprotein translocase subunit SecE [Streptomyces sp. CNQ085]|uniref:preprotein translocase subunit SecE n=1 Tax=Streptomyces sp. CNQ085 TaxID=2886944 RepID=UPI001F514985|nr:preprotein translocase subunit SecE [Streptomyces sp. CNQ085]MCI0384197.1 preprotein translocase subunit SecE [Streptomyces sp. CNQ085]